MRAGKMAQKCKVLLWTFSCCMLMNFAVHAQNATKKITGTVKDDKGTPLMGVTVEVKKEKIITTTNASGVFTINVPENATTLILSYVGMEKQEVNISGSNIINAELKPVSTNLNDVIVIGYGTAKRASVSSSISSVSAKDIKDLPVSGVDQALQGKVAGVTVMNNSGQPGELSMENRILTQHFQGINNTIYFFIFLALLIRKIWQRFSYNFLTIPTIFKISITA